MLTNGEWKYQTFYSFAERGHQKNNTAYFVYGSEGEGTEPESFYPDVEMFIGEGGSFLIPEVVREEKKVFRQEQKLKERKLSVVFVLHPGF